MFTDDFKQTIKDCEYIRPQLQKMMGGQIIGIDTNTLIYLGKGEKHD
ncbi:MAG TPA: hypothetical protein PLS20_09655 [Ruminococcus flavefaciens]|nr:hypothetical protein [Ruminococcus flavefaciens]